MFYKIGFWILLIVTIIFIGLFLYTNPMKRTGAQSWTEFYSDAPSETIGFLNENFGISVVETTSTDGFGEYNIIKTRGQLFPFAGIMQTPTAQNGVKSPAGTAIYLTVRDYDAAHEKAIASGAVAAATHMKAGGMYFGYYVIPGNVVIGIVQYENIPGDDE